MRLSSMTYSEGLDCDVLPLNMFFIWAYNNWHLNRFWRQKYLKQDQGRANNFWCKRKKECSSFIYKISKEILIGK